MSCAKVCFQKNSSLAGCRVFQTAGCRLLVPKDRIESMAHSRFVGGYGGWLRQPRLGGAAGSRDCNHMAIAGKIPHFVVGKYIFQSNQ